MNRAERIAAAADETVAGWTALTAEDRSALVEALRHAGVVRKVESGGHIVQVGGDAFPVWCPDEDAIDRVIAEHLVRPGSGFNTP